MPPPPFINFLYGLNLVPPLFSIPFTWPLWSLYRVACTDSFVVFFAPFEYKELLTAPLLLFETAALPLVPSLGFIFKFWSVSNLLINSYTCCMFISPEFSLSNTLKTYWYSYRSRLNSFCCVLYSSSIWEAFSVLESPGFLSNSDNLNA